MDFSEKNRAITGCLLGTAVGDAMGLPMEGLSRGRQILMFPALEGPCLLGKKGMFSDDTEHTCMTAQALLSSNGDSNIFLKNLSWRLRFWLLGLPPGVGLATLRSILKLWIGYRPSESGVFSAGNGPAMRSAILGTVYSHQPSLWQKLIPLSTRLTHRDPRATVGATAIALAASSSAQGEFSPEGFCHTMEEILVGKEIEFLSLLEKAGESAKRKETPSQFAEQIGLQKGVSGYIYHTVPVVLQAWWRYPENYKEAIIEIIRCGGDTDTTAAILGGIIGAHVGKEGIPEEWRNRIWEWPRNMRWIEALGNRLTHMVVEGKNYPSLFLPIWVLPFRNLFLLSIVLGYGFRRLLPPY